MMASSAGEDGTTGHLPDVSLEDKENNHVGEAPEEEAPMETPAEALSNDVLLDSNSLNGASAEEEPGHTHENGNSTERELEDGPLDSALSEPDVLPLVLTDSTPPSVEPKRKEELLAQARTDRRKWVQRVPLPFRSLRDPSDFWTLEQRLATFKASAACQRLPSLLPVLAKLYGMDKQQLTSQELADRLESVVGNMKEMEAANKSFESEVDQTESHHDPEMLSSYHQFWTSLLEPECALLVQGMRNHIQTLKGMTLEAMPSSLKSYLQGLFESLQSHVVWKDKADINVRRSLESFIFGQAQPYLDDLEWSGMFQLTEASFAERLEKLHFVKASHLDVDCLASLNDVDSILADPMLALLSVDQYFSPYEKLQRILAVYQGVNSALSESMKTAAAANGAEAKLPSADDVLPTIILTVLRARPVGLLRSIQVIENFCPQEYLRAEAGYAYTNLYGAIQFIQDIDMENPESLSINPEEFKKHIQECRTKAKDRLSEIISSAEDAVKVSEVSIPISAQDVMQARLQGETINIEWALKQETGSSSETTPSSLVQDIPDAALPAGFSRSYAFLNSKPDDIRISDLPKLLEEYHTLIQTTELLLGERSQRHSLEKKRKKTEKLQHWVDNGLIDSSSFQEQRNARDRSLTQ